MPRIGQKRFTEDKRCLILADFIEGVPEAEIAKRHGCVKSYPRVLARREGIRKQRSLRSRGMWKRKKETKAKRDWLRVGKRHHAARERMSQRDWLHI